MTDINHQAIDAAAATAGKVTGTTSVGLIVYGGLTVQEWGIVAGVVIGLLSLIIQSAINFHFKNQMLKLERIRLDNDINDSSKSEG